MISTILYKKFVKTGHSIVSWKYIRWFHVIFTGKSVFIAISYKKNFRENNWLPIRFTVRLFSRKISKVIQNLLQNDKTISRKISMYCTCTQFFVKMNNMKHFRIHWSKSISRNINCWEEVWLILIFPQISITLFWTYL